MEAQADSLSGEVLLSGTLLLCLQLAEGEREPLRPFDESSDAVPEGSSPVT